MVVFVYVFPRLPGFTLPKNPWPAALIFTISELVFTAVSFGTAASAGLIMGFWAGMSGAGSKNASVIVIMPVLLAIAVLYMFSTALIAASQPKLNKSVPVKNKSMPFIGALIFLLIYGTVAGAIALCVLCFYSAGKAGYIDKTGKFVIEPKYQRTKRFVNGVARVATDSSPEPPFSYNYRYIDRTGTVVATPKDLSMFEPKPTLKLDDDPAIYENQGSFSVGSYEIKHGNLFMLPFSEGLAAAKFKESGNGWGFVDKSFNFVIPPKSYGDVRHFTEGLAPAKQDFYDGLWGFVNKSGKWVIEPKFEEAYCFSEGLACVMVREKKDQQRELYGFIDKTGKYVIEPKFSNADSFSEGLAPATRY